MLIWWANITVCPPPLLLYPLFLGGRSRFRGSSNSNNPNLMYQDECDRRMRSVGGGGSAKDSRSSSSSYGRDSRGGSSRDGDRSSSSYRDRSGREGGRSYSSSTSTNSYDQYQNNNNGSSQYSSSRASSGSGGGGVGQAPPPSSGPQPLMSQQFNPPQPMMGLMGHSPFQFTSPSGRK